MNGLFPINCHLSMINLDIFKDDDTGNKHMAEQEYIVFCVLFYRGVNILRVTGDDLADFQSSSFPHCRTKIPIMLPLVFLNPLRSRDYLTAIIFYCLHYLFAGGIQYPVLWLPSRDRRPVALTKYKLLFTHLSGVQSFGLCQLYCSIQQ